VCSFTTAAAAAAASKKLLLEDVKSSRTAGGWKALEGAKLLVCYN
jgi:hypothetical protein